MVRGTTGVLEWLELNGHKLWRLRKGDNLMFVAPADIATIDDSLKELEKRLTLLDAGDYLIEAFDDNTARNLYKKIRFTIGSTQNAINGFGAAQINSGVDVQSEVFKALENYKKEQEIERLKEENKVLGETDAAIGRLIGKIEPYLPALLGALVGQKSPANISGLPKNKNKYTKQAMDLNTRAEIALTRWVEKDPQAIELLEAIVKLAQTNTVMYNQAKTMLLNS